MAKRRIILMSAVFLFITLFTVQTLSQTGGSTLPKPLGVEDMRNMTEKEKKREIERRLKEQKLEHERKHKEFIERADEHRRKSELEAKQRREKWKEEEQEAAGFIFEKYALGATEEQWKLIKPKLEEVRLLRREARLPVVAVWGIHRLPGAKGPEYPAPQYLHEWSWKWHRPSKGKRYAELTQDQRTIEDLIDLIESRNATADKFKRAMDAFTQDRGRQETEKKEKQKELSDAQQELKKLLTTRQEAVLVLAGWL